MRDIEWDFLQKNPAALESRAGARQAMAPLEDQMINLRQDLEALDGLHQRLAKISMAGSDTVPGENPREQSAGKPTQSRSRRVAAHERLLGISAAVAPGDDDGGSLNDLTAG